MMTFRSLSSALTREARLLRMAPLGPNSTTPHPENIPHAAEFTDRNTKPLESPQETPEAVRAAKSHTKDQLQKSEQTLISQLKKEQDMLREQIKEKENQKLDTTKLEGLLESLQKTTQGGEIEDMASTVKSIMKMAYDIQDIAEEFSASLTPEEVSAMESIVPKFEKIVADTQAYNLLAELSVTIGFPTVADVPDTPEGKKLRTLLQEFTPQEAALLSRYYRTIFTRISDDLPKMGLENPYTLPQKKGRESDPRTASYFTSMRRTDDASDPKAGSGTDRNDAIEVWNAARSQEEKKQAEAMMMKGGVDVVSIQNYVASWNEAPSGSPDRTINEGWLMIYGVNVETSNLEKEEIHFFTDDERLMGVLGGFFMVGFGYLAKFGNMVDTKKNTSKDSLEYTNNSQADTPEARGKKITKLTKSVKETQTKIGDLSKRIKTMEEEPNKPGAAENPVLAQAKAQLKELEASLKKMNEALAAVENTDAVAVGNSTKKKKDV